MKLVLKIVLLISTLLQQSQEKFLAPAFKIDQFEEMTEQVGMLLNNCTRLQVNNIAVMSDSPATIKWTTKSLERISLLNLRISDLTKQFRWKMSWREKFHTFIIITSEEEDLEYFIEGLKNTTLWNPSALYFLLDSSTLRNGCLKADGFLNTASRYKLISSTFFCVDRANGVMAYTSNPFSPWAPKSWTKVTFSTEARNVFETKVIPGVTTCKDFTFDKTRIVTEYYVLWGLNSSPGVYEKTYWVIQAHKTEHEILKTLKSKWNDVGEIFPLEDEKRMIERGADEILREAVKLKSQFIHDTQHMTTTYPHRSIGFAILTRFPGYAAPYEKILRYMNPLFIAGILLISLATGIVLGKCTGQGETSGSLEVLRIMLGGSMIRFPESNPLKIHIITIMLLFMLSTSTFQGNLSSLLTAPIMNPLIDSMEDLKQSGYPIYIFHDHKSKITDDVLYSQIRPSDSWDCSEFVENFEGVACLAERDQMLKTAYWKHLYLSKNSFNYMYAAFVVPRDWPLIDAMSRTLLMMNEGGLLNYVSHEVSHESAYYTKWQRMEADVASKDYRNLNLRNVSFAFYILVVGYGISMVVFVVEVVASRLSQRRVIVPFVV